MALSHKAKVGVLVLAMVGAGVAGWLALDDSSHASDVETFIENSELLNRVYCDRIADCTSAAQAFCRQQYGMDARKVESLPLANGKTAFRFQCIDPRTEMPM